MGFLSASDVRGRAQEVRVTLERLLAMRSVVGQPTAAQWRFVGSCLDRVLGRGNSEFDRLRPQRAAQLKFQAREKLR